MRAKRSRLFLAGALVVPVGLLAWSLFTSGWLGTARAGGEPAPGIRLRTANGEFDLSRQRGTVVVLYFSFPG